MESAGDEAYILLKKGVGVGTKGESCSLRCSAMNWLSGRGYLLTVLVIMSMHSYTRTSHGQVCFLSFFIIFQVVTEY